MTTDPTLNKLLYGRREAAKLLSVSTGHISNGIRAGNIRAVRLGRRHLIPRSELQRLAGQ